MASPAELSCASGYTLGSGEDLRVILMPRGGGRILAEFRPDSGEFTRSLDRTSEMNMTATTGGNTNCSGWDLLAPWATEILIVRDGRDAWCGPVTDVKFNVGKVEVKAQDLTAWWNRRIIPKDLKFTNVDAAQVLKAIHDSAMEVDPISGFDLTITNTGEEITREYLYIQSTYAHDAIDELSKSSIDWSAYGRSILVGGTEIEADPRITLHDDMWVDPPQIHAIGGSMATHITINAKENILGKATSNDERIAYYGRIERIFDEPDIEDQEGADRAAATRLALLEDPFYIESPSGAGLKPSAPITLPQLICGMRVRVVSQATCKKIVSDFRLSGVKVNFDGSVYVDLQPLGSLDDSMGS